LIDLAQHGFTSGPTTYPIQIVISIRDLYGENAAKEANSVRALEAMRAVGIEVETQRTATSERFLHTTTAKML
jgi:hypothetical protein